MFKSDEDTDPIIIKDGIEIETIEDLSGDEIESISVLKAKEAIEKYGSKGVHGVIEITERRKTNAKQSLLLFKTLCMFILHRVYCFEDYTFSLHCRFH